MALYCILLHCKNLPATKNAAESRILSLNKQSNLTPLCMMQHRVKSLLYKVLQGVKSLSCVMQRGLMLSSGESNNGLGSLWLSLSSPELTGKNITF
jgi:hypothetical protein